MVPQSNVHISGKQEAMCSTLSSALIISVPFPNFKGLEVGPKTISPPIPAVRFKTTSVFEFLILSVTSL